MVLAKRGNKDVQHESCNSDFATTDFHEVSVDAGCFSNGFVVFGCVIKDRCKKVVFASSKKIGSVAQQKRKLWP